MDSKALFEKTPPGKLFFMTAVPGSVGMLASAIYQFFEGIFVGRFLGDTAFAALNLAMPFVIINFALADLIGVGSAVPISISLGRKDNKTANNYFTCACIMVVLTGAVIGAFLYAAAPALMRLMGAEGAFASMAAEYLRVYAICSPITTIVFAMDNYLRICGKIRMSMYLNIFMAAFTVIIGYLFLGVFGWGIWSMALATCMGMIMTVTLSIMPFLRKKLLLRFVKPVFTFSLIKKIVLCGAPNFLNNIAGRITSIIINRILVFLNGETAVSVYGILMYIDGFVQPILYGMCDSLQPAVGYNWGAKKYSRVNSIEKYCFGASAAVSLLAAAVIALFPHQIVRLFTGSENTELMQMAVWALKIFCLTFITRWFSFAVQSYMLAIGRSAGATAISVSFAFIFPVVLLAILWGAGLNGVWMNFPLAALLAAIEAAVILIVFNKQKRKSHIL